MNKSMSCTTCFKSLGVPSRMGIYRYLSEHQEATVTEIVDYIKLKQPTISYHLKEMKSSGILKHKKRGKEVYYSLNHLCPHCGDSCVLKGVHFPKHVYAD